MTARCFNQDGLSFQKQDVDESLGAPEPDSLDSNSGSATG